MNVIPVMIDVTIYDNFILDKDMFIIYFAFSCNFFAFGFYRNK